MRLPLISQPVFFGITNMPTYDYVCDACEHAFEEFQSITAPKLTKCPECGKKKLRRLIGSGAAIVFKGSGFYQTDYRSSEYKKKASAEAKNSSSKDSSSNAKESGSAKKDSSTKPSSSSTKASGES